MTTSAVDLRMKHSFYVQLLATAVNLVINFYLLTYGSDKDIAAVTIMASIFSFYHMVVFGIVQGNNSICGYNWGAKEYERVRASLKLSLFYAFLLLPQHEAEKLEHLANGITEIMDFDLIIFLEPVENPLQDGTRNEEILNNQEKYSKDLKSLLKNYDMPIFEIDGKFDERYRKVIDIITQHLNILPYYNENVNSFDFENFKESLFM